MPAEEMRLSRTVQERAEGSSACVDNTSSQSRARVVEKLKDVAGGSLRAEGATPSCAERLPKEPNDYANKGRTHVKLLHGAQNARQAISP